VLTNAPRFCFWKADHMSWVHAKKAVRERIAKNQQRVRGVHDREERELEAIRELNRKTAAQTPAQKDKPVIVI
jgi:hypothetical protein